MRKVARASLHSAGMKRCQRPASIFGGQSSLPPAGTRLSQDSRQHSSISAPSRRRSASPQCMRCVAGAGRAPGQGQRAPRRARHRRAVPAGWARRQAAEKRDAAHALVGAGIPPRAACRAHHRRPRWGRRRTSTACGGGGAMQEGTARRLRRVQLSTAAGQIIAKGTHQACGLFEVRINERRPDDHFAFLVRKIGDIF